MENETDAALNTQPLSSSSVEENAKTQSGQNHISVENKTISDPPSQHRQKKVRFDIKEGEGTENEKTLMVRESKMSNGTAIRITKQRIKSGVKKYLVEWEGNYKPSWQVQEDVSGELKRQFHIKHTKKGTRRKRTYKYFD